jgi:ABC-type Co2+ transport system permease subunit
LVLDATKLIFASLVLGTVIKGEIPQSTLLVSGIIASVTGAVVGLIFTTIFEEK